MQKVIKWLGSNCTLSTKKTISCLKKS